MNIIKIFLGSCLIKMSNQISRHRTSYLFNELKIIERLADLIIQSSGMPQCVAFAELNLGVRQSTRVHKGLMATKSYTIGFKKGCYFNKIKKQQETLV